MNENEFEQSAIEDQPVEQQPTPVVSKGNTPPAAAKNAAVSGNAVDDVLLSQCVYKNMYARKSLSVHHIQRRLVEWGYNDAVGDRDGWYGDLTKASVAAFQAAHNLQGAGEMNADTLAALFNGDENVNVVI
jgi:peptidoglycan hydrolase-like protein with peptidoglycan-binding domain